MVIKSEGYDGRVWYYIGNDKLAVALVELSHNGYTLGNPIGMGEAEHFILYKEGKNTNVGLHLRVNHNELPHIISVPEKIPLSQLGLEGIAERNFSK